MRRALFGTALPLAHTERSRGIGGRDAPVRPLRKWTPVAALRSRETSPDDDLGPSDTKRLGSASETWMGGFPYDGATRADRELQR